MGFEQDIERMEEITKQLQDNATSLDDSIKLFEEGVELARKVEKALDRIEQKVEVLLSSTDTATEEPEIAPFAQES